MKWLKEARNKLAHESLQDVPRDFLERAFSHTERLASKCASHHTEVNIQRLKLQWDKHESSKRSRKQAGAGQ